MAQNVFLFMGEDYYRLHQEIDRWKQEFVRKYGQDSLSVFGAGASIDDAVHALRGGGLFASKKMIVVYGVPLDTISHNKRRTDDVDMFIDACGSVSDDVLVVLVSYKPDKRTSGYKFFKKSAQLKEFKPLKGKRLESYIDDVSSDVLPSSLVSHFVTRCGEDLYRLTHELDKLRFYLRHHDKKTITKDMIDLVVFGDVEANNFAFLDALFVDQKKALSVLDDAESSGTPWMLFTGALYRGLRIMIQMMFLYQQGKTSSGALAKSIGCPPFTVGRYVKFVDELLADQERVVTFFSFVERVDFSIKTGRFPDSVFWPLMKYRVHALSA